MERLSDYLHWSGQLTLSSGDRLKFESSLSPSLRLQTSLSIHEMNRWLEERVSSENPILRFSWCGSA